MKKLSNLLNVKEALAWVVLVTILILMGNVVTAEAALAIPHPKKVVSGNVEPCPTRNLLKPSVCVPRFFLHITVALTQSDLVRRINARLFCKVAVFG